MLGPGCEEAAMSAIHAWPSTAFLSLQFVNLDGLQLAGGINSGNAKTWIERGASKVIVTSYLFPDAKFSLERLIELEKLIGRDRLVVDVRYVHCCIGLIASCRRREGKWFVTMNRWQTITDMEVNKGMSHEPYC